MPAKPRVVSGSVLMGMMLAHGQFVGNNGRCSYFEIAMGNEGILEISVTVR